MFAGVYHYSLTKLSVWICNWSSSNMCIDTTEHTSRITFSHVMSGNWIKYSNTASLYSCCWAMRQLSESIHSSLPSVQCNHSKLWRILIWEDRTPPPPSVVAAEGRSLMSSWKSLGGSLWSQAISQFSINWEDPDKNRSDKADQTLHQSEIKHWASYWKV